MSGGSWEGTGVEVPSALASSNMRSAISGSPMALIMAARMDSTFPSRCPSWPFDQAMGPLHGSVGFVGIHRQACK